MACTAGSGVDTFMGFFFVAAGVGMLLFGLHLRRRDRVQAELRARSPERPWLWRPEWVSGRVPCQSRATALVIWIFAGFWNAFFFAAFWAGLTLPVVPFALVGVVVLGFAIRATRRWLRFGRSAFELTTLPGVIGGRIAGTIFTGGPVPAADGLLATLTCVERWGDDERVLWREEQLISAERLSVGSSGTAVPIEFAIPRGRDETSAGLHDDGIVWRLEVSADAPGVRYEALFEVPVFRTADSSEASDLELGFEEPCIGATRRWS